MNGENGASGDDRHYAPYRSLHGRLQRGHGIAVALLRRRPERSQVVYECTTRETRWDRQVDDRHTYLARLLRDLRFDPAPLVAQMRACGPDQPPPGDPTADDRFDLAVGILEVLARGGDEQARAALRGYVRDGARWLDVLSRLVEGWPVRWWDDLWESAAARIDAADAERVWPVGNPWQRWRGRDPRLDRVIDAAARARPNTVDRRETVDRSKTVDRRDTADRRDALAAASDADLIALLRSAGDDRPTVSRLLRQIRRRGRPVPEILEVVERLAPLRPPGLFGVLGRLGPQILPAARRWAGDSGHPLFRDAPHLLAAHADERDIPVLLASLDHLADNWCGHDVPTEGLARILAECPPRAHADTRATLTRRLYWLTDASPHSYERASYLRSLLLLDPERVTGLLPVHLLDCEPAVRLLAARHTPLTDVARQRLTELRDDPVEDDEIRAVAAGRVQPT